MNEAIDYNALNWVRQELGKVLRQACSFLEEYSGNPDNTACLQDCARNLHLARGPLQMVGLKGADQLASEMEELIADLLQATLVQPGAALEVLMQAFLQLPDYLSRLNSGKTDTPAVLLPVINSLREVRGVPVLDVSAVFSPNLALSVPTDVFTAHLSVPDGEIQAKARAARLRFQAGLLEWYRGNEGNTGLQTLDSVLRKMLQDAGLESVARLWWAAAAVTEAMIEGDIPETTENKQMFGQLDRQIKRFIDSGESVFADPLTDKLMKRLLYRIAITESSLESIQAIKETYNLNKQLEESGDRTATDESLSGCSDELLKTVAVTASADIDRIKDRLDIFTRGTGGDPGSLLPVADELHALGNMLDMVGIDQLGNTVVEKAQLIRDMAAGASDIEESVLVDVADLLVAVEDAARNLGGSNSRSQDGGANGLYLREGMQALIREAVVEMARAKEAIVEFIKSPDDFECLSGVPGLLSRVRGSLQLSGQERAAVVAGRIEQFIAGELIEQHNSLSDSQFEHLADAVCSIEYYIEESGEDHAQGDRVLGFAEESLAALGYACSVLTAEEDQTGVVQDDVPAQQSQYKPCMVADSPRCRPADSLAEPVITDLQIIDAGADEEILAIFIEEADEVLVQLGEQLPAWSVATDNTELLEEASRGFHTIKGSGRMVGALALGEFSWTFENLLNRVIDGTVEPGDELLDLLGQSVDTMKQLLAQVKDGNAVLEADVNALARKAVMLSQPGMQLVDLPGEAVVGTAGATPTAQTGFSGLPVLADDADPEIVEIFLEEAAEEIASISENIPQWISQPDNPGVLEALRCGLHNLKGSSRMTGALVMGEFSWTLENLFNKVADGSVEANDPVFVLLARVPVALQQLYKQLRDGVAPELDIEEVVAHAEALVRGEVVEPAAADDTVQVELSADEQPVPEENEATEDIPEDDPGLLEIFSRECSENLRLIEEFLGSNRAPCAVTESLYRSLHTISGISNSANVSSVRNLAGALDGYFDGLYEGHHLAGADALDVLRDSAAEINRLIKQLPDMSFDEEFQQRMCARVEALSKSGVAQPADDPYSSVDSELLDVFIEEASEIIDAGENTLRAWSEEPENHELMAEFQRQLHTLKGGARMADITPIGDLSHTLESLLTRVVEGQIETSPDLFILLQDSHDHLAEMLEHVKVRKLPADAGELTMVINGMGLDAGGVSDSEPAHASAENEKDNAPVSEVDVAVVEELESESEPGAVFDSVAEQTLASEPEPGPETAAEPVIESEHEPEPVPGFGPEPESESESEPEPGAGAGEEPATEAGMEPLEILPEPAMLQKMGVLPPKVEHRKGTRVRSEQVRVRADLLDSMVNYAGEINIYRARMEQQISDYRYNLGELDQTIGRLREQLRQVEIETEVHILFRYEQEGEILDQDFDPLEMDRYSNLQQLSRSLNESINDLRSIQELMEHTTRESETLLLQQSRVSTDLQEGLLHSRMIPFSGIAPRLRRILRQSAKELGKKVDLKLEGADGEMDRTVIERIIAPLEHMLRNAVAHGIEPPAIRRQSGKPAIGSVAISFQREGSEIVLHIEDDGAGLDIEAIRTRAIERNLLDADASLPDSDIMQFVLQTGFTTAAEVTQISGRGVGLDVVNGEVKQLGGSLHITSTAGAGTVFTVRLPYKLAVNQALQVKAGEETFCIPLGCVEGVARISPEELADCYQSEDNILDYADNCYQLKHLGSLLGCGGMEQGVQQGRVPVLLVRLGEKRVAFQLESILGSREIVIKPLGAQLSNVDGISGATILGDGRVVLILDVMSISRLHGRVAVPDMRAASRGDERLNVMVVDDSITVRKVTSRLLGRNGFRVLTAKDGVDAMGQLQENVPDIMLLDIEMPRMDGFELATHMHNDERLKHVPIIMITSRTGDKHREHAKQIGVNSYLGKPYQESELLESIQSLIEVRNREECA